MNLRVPLDEPGSRAAMNMEGRTNTLVTARQARRARRRERD